MQPGIPARAALCRTCRGADVRPVGRRIAGRCRGLPVRAAGRRPRRRRDRCRARFGCTTAARSASPASSRPRASKPSRRAALAAVIAGRDVTLARRRRQPRPLRPPARFRLSRRLRYAGAKRAAGAGRGAGIVRLLPTRTAPRSSLPPRPRRAGPGGEPGPIRHGHKKRGKSGRYFGRDRALHRGRGQGFVGQAGRGNDLPEFRTELDTGLCCDYFKAHGARRIESAGIGLKSLENRRIRVRGWVEARGGPRIELLRVGQIEVLGGN